MSLATRKDPRSLQIIKASNTTTRTLGMPEVLSKCGTFGKNILDVVNAANKPLFSSPDELVAEALNRVKDDFALDSYGSDRKALSAAYDIMANSIWQRVNREEGLDYTNRIFNHDEKFIAEFFVGLDKGQPKIAPICNEICKKFNSSYKYLQLTPKEVSHLVLDIVYADGSWRPLKSFKYLTSIYSYLEDVCMHDIYKALKKQGRIKTKRAMTTDNTKLAFKNTNVNTRFFLIDTCVHAEDLRRILFLVYVHGLSKEQICECDGMEGAAFDDLLEKAEKKLRDGMINSYYDFSDFLKTDKPDVSPIALDDLTNETVVYDPSASWIDDLLENRLGITNFTGDSQLYVQMVIDDCVSRAGFSEFDLAVWRMRFIDRISAKEAAKLLDVRSYIVDQHYSHICATLRPMIKDMLTNGDLL